MRIEEAEPSSSSGGSSGADMPPASAALLRKIVATSSEEEFVDAINKGREVHAVMGKTELYKWTEVLNRCDEILEKGTFKNEHGDMRCDSDQDIKKNVVSVIRFTVLLFECTSSRRIYKSIDRILLLLECTDMDTLAEVLRLLQVMGKRSKFLSQRIPGKEQHSLAQRLTAIAQCWGGKLRPVKMAECLKREPKLPVLFPFQYTDSKARLLTVDTPKPGETVGELIDRTITQLTTPVGSTETPQQLFSKEDRFCLLSRLRMLIKFDDWTHRFKCLIVRLLAVSTLVYCRLGGTDENTISSLLYAGFVEEIVDLLKADREADSDKDYMLHDGIQTEALSTLCSIVTYEKEPKIQAILEALSAGSYHGFLSVMTRQIVDELKNNNLGKPMKPSVGLATSLFSFIYHLASIEPGGDTLVGSGLTQTLLSVIGFHELPIECITFGTRCARIIDLFTTIDVTAFKANNGMEICVNRVVHEVEECRKDQPFVIDTSYDVPFEDEPEPQEDDDDDDDDEEAAPEAGAAPVQAPEAVDPELEAIIQESHHLRGNRREEFIPPGPPTSSPASMDPSIKGGPWELVQHNGTSCHQQRSGLIKGLLTFIKRAIGDVQFQDLMKHLMEGGLPEALMHILSNAEYYSPSLFHQSAHLITNFVYQFPEELSSLQRRHVPYVIFQSLLRKELPNSKDVITTLGNVFTALCLNARGKRQFKSYDPFDQIFRIVLSVKFLVTIRKKRSSDMFESAQAIGGAMDDLMRHNPDLKHDMLKSIIVILDLLDSLGQSPPENVELVPTLTKTMARSVVFASSVQSLLPPREPQGEAATASAGPAPVVHAAPEQADERVGGDAGEEEPMEVEDAEDSDVDEEDNEMSMDEMSGEAVIATPAAPTPKPSVAKPLEYSAGMMCEDGTGKKILPIGDYMLLIARVVETMMTQSPTQKIVDEFIEANGMQKIMKLCHLPCIANEATHATYIACIANIIKHIVKAAFQGQRNTPESGQKLLLAIVEEFTKVINPIINPQSVASGDFSALQYEKRATLLMIQDEKVVEKTLVELNSIVPIMLNLNKNPMSSSYSSNDTRGRIFELWKMPEGIALYTKLRKLSRMLCWEHDLIQTLKPTIRTAATQTEGEMLSDQPADTHLDVEVMPPWNEDDTLMEAKKDLDPKKPARWKTAGVTEEEHDFWSKNKHLQDIVTKSHHLVKELLNMMNKSINTVNQRRPRHRDANQPVPLVTTQCISMIFSSIYKDLKWEPKQENISPMGYGRYIELLTQINNTLFETNGRCPNAALVQNFYTSGCHDAFFELFNKKIVPNLGKDMSEGVERTMEEWCKLAAKLTDKNAIVSIDHQLQARRDRSLSPEFDTNKYLKLVCRDMFNAYKGFFEKLASLDDGHLKFLKRVCENTFSVFKEVAKNLVEESEDTDPANTPPEEVAPGFPRAPAVPVAVPIPAIPDEQVQILMDLGFSREIALYALESTNSTDEAANFLLAHGHEFQNDHVLRQGLLAGIHGHERAVAAAAAPAAPEPNVANASVILNRLLIDGSSVIDLIAAAREALIEANLLNFVADLDELFPESVHGSLTRETIISQILHRIGNPQLAYEENIAQPLIPPLSQMKIEQEGSRSLADACKQLFPLVKRLLLVSNDTIHPCAELIISIFPAMEPVWRKDHLIAEIIGDDLLQMTKDLSQQKLEKNGRPVNHQTARYMANRLHFAVLIFDNVSEEYITWIDENKLVDEMLVALEYLVKRFQDVDYYQSLITRIICWFDLYAKTHRLITRRNYLQSLSKTLEWSFQAYEDETMRRRADFTTLERKWMPHDAAAQKILNEAFFKGARGCKCSVKRGNRAAKKVEVDFGSMRQADSTNRDNIKAELPASVQVNLEDLMRSEATLSWTEDQNDRLIKAVIEVMKMGALDPKCSHSVLNFVSRQTKSARNAKQFMELEGMPAILRLKARCASTYPFLVSVIIRNCIDDDVLLTNVYEKTIRTMIATPSHPPSSMSEYASTKTKDFSDTLNQLAPLSSRNPLVFTEAFNKLARLSGSEVLPMKKAAAATGSSEGQITPSSSAVSVPQTPTTSAASAPAASSSSTTIIENNDRAVSVIRMMISEVFDGEFPTTGQTRMLSQEKILTILAEIIKSYPSLAITIAETQHDGKSALHSLIDTYISAPVEKSDTANALKTLIAVIAASQHASKAQEMLVLDIKAALAAYSEKASELRKEAVVLQNHPDSNQEEREMAFDELHKDEKILLTKISELCGIVVTMCQSCPPPHHHHHSERRERVQHNQNAVMKLFHKKKMCADLVKTIHCLELSTKDSMDTVNNILKTLETLLEGSANPGSLNQASRSFMEMFAGRSAARERRDQLEREMDQLINEELNFDPEMRNLLRRLNDDSVPLRARRVEGPIEDDEGSDQSDRERSDSPSEASEHGGGAEEAEVRDDAVEAGDGDVNMVDVEPGEAPAPVAEAEDAEMPMAREAEDDGEEEDEDGDQDEDNNVEDDHPREEDDDDEDVDDEEDGDDDDDDHEVVHMEQNPEPAVRRLLVEDDDDEDDDGDEDGDSIEDDPRGMDLDDDYFEMGGPFADVRMDEMIFPPSFGRSAAAFADMFRDDFDFFRSRPPVRDRRPLGRSIGLGGIMNDHPLMVRPPADNEMSRRPAASYRAEIMMHGGTRSSLTRQNAIRRTTEIRELEAISRGIRMGEMPPSRMLIRGAGPSDSIHTSFLDHIFDVRPSSGFPRLAAYRNYSTGFQDREDRRDIRASQVPSCLDRLESYTQAMESVSIRFVNVVVNSHLMAFHKAREAQIKRDLEAKARAKKEIDAAKKALDDKKKADALAAAAPPATDAPAPPPSGEDIGLAQPAATNTTNTVSDTQAPNAAAVRGEDTATTPALNPIVPDEEPMETGDDDAPLPQSSAATAASSVAGVDDLDEAEVNRVPLEDDTLDHDDQEEEVEDPPGRVRQDQPAEHAAPVPQQAPAVREDPMAEEFRAILGDIDIPEGVDPAFLAALPEEMRAEVIRDYQRQQRAERASRPVAAQPAAQEPAAPVAEGAPMAPAPAGEAPAAPLVEPIDPVFLNALPPDLQEEVLAEHERRLREAEEQVRRQNAPPAPVVEMDGAAVIASLPLNERAQVLAEMDEAELAGLPVEMQNEARRARQQHVEPNMMRYHRLLFRGAPPGAGPGVGVHIGRSGARVGRPPGHAGSGGANAGPTIGQHAGLAHQAPSDVSNLLDRESIQTLCLLYLIDNNRVQHSRLQKVLRSACVNQTTCDFIVWCLLALLDKASESSSDDDDMTSQVPAWLDSIAVSGVGQHEKVLRISENAQKVSIHSLLAVPMCKNILDLLASIARAYPGNFLPAMLRHNAKATDVCKQAPTFQQFWTMVQNTSKTPKCKDWSVTADQQLEECPLGQMLNSLQKPTMAKSPLKEKVLKVASQIMVTLPMDTCTLLNIDKKTHQPLRQKLEYVIRVMTTGPCTTEGLNDGLTILSEAMRTFSDDTSVQIYNNLFAAVSKLGSELLPQIDHLIVELDEAQKSEDGVPAADQPSTSQPKSKSVQIVVDNNAAGRSAIGRFDGERLVIDGDQNMRLHMSSCKELQLPAVTVLTDKGGAQYALLSALQTLVKVRNHMKSIRKDKAKRAKEAEKKKADEKKKVEEEKNKQSSSTSAASDAPAPTPAASEATPAPEVPVAVAEEIVVAEEEPRISERLSDLEKLWNSLSECLLRLGRASDPHAVLALQPAAEAFFLVHAAHPQKAKALKEAAEAKRKESQAAGGAGPSTSSAAVASSASHDGLREDLDPDTSKLIEFAEKHRQVLNQALRQNNAVLSAGGPFAVLTQFPKLLDFDVKRKFFRKELTKLEPTVPRYRRNDVTVQVSRSRVFSESFRELFRLAPSQWKNRFYVIFQGEEAQDAGGVLREWFSVITREIFNPNYALFTTAPGDMVTYMINKASYINPEHLDYFKFVGRLIAKSVFEHKYLDCYFTRAFYKHILNLPVRYQDLESEDPAFFNSLDFLLQNNIDELSLDLTFSTEVEEFGVRSVRDLKPNGRKIDVTDANKEEYVKLVCQTKMTGSIRKQLDAFLTGFYEIIPKDLISMFNEQELELLISGLPDVDIDDLAANTDYKGFQKTATQIQWFWRALRSFEKEDKAKFLQFVTGTSKVPLQGFSSLEGMNGVQKFSIHLDSRGGDRLPAAHTCFNQLDLPQYDSYEKLRHQLLLAIRECTEGFGFA